MAAVVVHHKVVDIALAVDMVAAGTVHLEAGAGREEVKAAGTALVDRAVAVGMPPSADYKMAVADCHTVEVVDRAVAGIAVMAGIVQLEADADMEVVGSVEMVQVAGTSFEELLCFLAQTLFVASVGLSFLAGSGVAEILS